MVPSNLDVLLRDLPKNVHQVDTLYLATDEAHATTLHELARRWHANSVRRCPPGPLPGFAGWSQHGVVLRLWWD